MFSEERLIGIKLIILIIMGSLSMLGICYIVDHESIGKPIDYYENGIKIEAIEYHNEIYLKKGE